MEPEYCDVPKIFLLSKALSSQIWLNPLVDDGLPIHLLLQNYLIFQIKKKPG
jgi:hypothetical protein